MKKPGNLSLLFMLSSFLVFGCTKDYQTIEGDLYFSPLRFGSFYNQPDSLVCKFISYVDSVDQLNADEDVRKILTMYKVLKSENLQYNPFADIRLDNDSVIRLYLEKSEYDRIRIHRRKELQMSKKKIRLKVQGKDLGNGMVICKNLISIYKIDGVTLQVQKKYKIDDYQ